MFLEAAVRLRGEMRGSPPTQNELRFLLGCGVERDTCPHGLVLLVAAALTSDRSETPHQHWMSEIREGFGQTVADLVQIATVRHDYHEPEMLLAVLRSKGRIGALAQTLRTAQLASRLSQDLGAIQRGASFARSARFPTHEDVFTDGAFITAVSSETTCFAPGFNRVVEIAINIRTGLLEALKPVTTGED